MTKDRIVDFEVRIYVYICVIFWASNEMASMAFSASINFNFEFLKKARGELKKYLCQHASGAGQPVVGVSGATVGCYSKSYLTEWQQVDARSSASSLPFSERAETNLMHRKTV